MARTSIETMLWDCQRLVRPGNSAFDNADQGTDTSGPLYYDDTAVWANQMFANGLASNLIPRARRWMFLRVRDVPSADLNNEQLLALESLTNMFMHDFSLPQANFYGANHEAFSNLGSYGTAPVEQCIRNGVVTYKARPLQDTFFDVDENDIPNTVYFRRYVTGRQMLRQFPNADTIEGFNSKDLSRRYELWYTCEPSEDHRARKGGRFGPERPYTVTWWSPNLKEALEVDGISYFPYRFGRWGKQSDENYGRSPAMTCIKQIKGLNAMRKNALKSSSYLNSPTLAVEEESIMLPMQFGENQVIEYTQGSQLPTPIEIGAQPSYLLEMIRDYKDTVIRSFFVDQILREQKKERQSVLEIQDERGQMLQQLSPMIGRLESDLLGPQIETHFELKARMGKLPEMPASLDGAELEVVYTSPASQAQYAAGIADMSAFIQDITPLAQADPTIVEGVNGREMLDEYARLRNLSPRMIRTEEQLEQIREQRAQAEQQQQMTDAIPGMAGAMKDVATAKEKDPEGIGQLLNIG